MVSRVKQRALSLSRTTPVHSCQNMTKNYPFHGAKPYNFLKENGMNTQKEARRDAAEYARAQLYYGDGAGTRRKLIQAVVDGKTHRDPSYGRQFRTELARQDMAEHAVKARHERARKDRNETLSRNAKGLVTGNYTTMNTSVVVIAVGAYVAHQTGLDVLIYDKARSMYQTYQNKRAARKNNSSTERFVFDLRHHRGHADGKATPSPKRVN